MGRARREKMKKQMVNEKGNILIGTTSEDPASPFNSYFKTFQSEEKKEVLEKAERVQENRSERAKEIDRRYNAPIPDKAEKWIEHPNRYDLPGVDTIPNKIQEKRVQRLVPILKEKGFVDEYKEDVEKGMSGIAGKYIPEYTGSSPKGKEGRKQVFIKKDDPRTKAHEIGHAIDYEKQERIMKEEGIRSSKATALRDFAVSDKKKTKLRTNRLIKDKIREEEKQAVKISERMRGKVSNDYRRKTSELTADALSSFILEPRAFKREAPDLYENLKSGIEEIGISEKEIRTGENDRRFF